MTPENIAPVTYKAVLGSTNTSALPSHTEKTAPATIKDRKPYTPSNPTKIAPSVADPLFHQTPKLPQLQLLRGWPVGLQLQTTKASMQ